MLRRVRTTLVAGSFLLLLVVCALWLRSRRTSDQLLWCGVTRDQRFVSSWYLAFLSGRGGIGLSRDAEVYEASAATLRPTPRRWEFHSWETASPAYPQAVFYRRPGTSPPTFAFHWRVKGDVLVTARRELILPYWSLALLLAIAPAVTARRIHRRRRAVRRGQAGLCPACGYDCRATPERCPECGAACKMPGSS